MFLCVFQPTDENGQPKGDPYVAFDSNPKLFVGEDEILADQFELIGDAGLAGLAAIGELAISRKTSDSSSEVPLEKLLTDLLKAGVKLGKERKV